MALMWVSITYSLICIVVAMVIVADGIYQEQACANVGGICMLSSSCTGTTRNRLCPTQAAALKCCIANDDASSEYVQSECPLVTVTRPQLQGVAVRVHPDFLPAINSINAYAEQAGVKVHVTSSFRKSNNVAGAIVVPATKSNHMVETHVAVNYECVDEDHALQTGHAIDMNVVYGAADQLCTSACLKGRLPPAVADFINMAYCLRFRRCATLTGVLQIRSDGNLRWGGDFSTPDVVHIDDGQNIRNAQQWEVQYMLIQQHC